MILRVKPDNQKSEALKKMAEITLARLKKTDIEEYPSNTLRDYYEIIHNLLEALSLREGVKIKGEGAHQELIDYIARQHGLEEQLRLFLQQMREYRNRIAYEGFMVHKNFISLNQEKIINIVNKLFNTLENTGK
ncbi:MAG: hypothetical protein AABX65_00570 [Nanoarchaeota archaeon]